MLDIKFWKNYVLQNKEIYIYKMFFIKIFFKMIINKISNKYTISFDYIVIMKNKIDFVIDK